MKRYSPSATETWLECPLKRHLSHAGWTPRKIGKREMGAILGGAFAQGVNAWKSTELAGQTADPEVCAEIAAGSAQAHCADLERAGAIIQEWDRAQYQAITRRASEGVRRIIAQDPIPPTWNLLDVERVIPEWGGCRIDLGLESPLGVIVWDWKCKLSLDAKWLPKEVEKYRLSEQRWHYSCAYRDFLKRPVYAFYIGLVILEPFRVHVPPYVNDPVDLVMWRQARGRRRGASVRWGSPRSITMNTGHVSSSGPAGSIISTRISWPRILSRGIQYEGSIDCGPAATTRD